MKILLDNGHGEETPGKCSPVWPDGSRLREYEFARDIVRRIFDRLHARGVVAEIVVPELRDVPLYVRSNRVNGICDVAGKSNCLLVSVHANAGGGTGWEAHTCLGDSMSDRYSAPVSYTHLTLPTILRVLMSLVHVLLYKKKKKLRNLGNTSSLTDHADSG